MGGCEGAATVMKREERREVGLSNGVEDRCGIDGSIICEDECGEVDRQKHKGGSCPGIDQRKDQGADTGGGSYISTGVITGTGYLIAEEAPLAAQFARSHHPVCQKAQTNELDPHLRIVDTYQNLLCRMA